MQAKSDKEWLLVTCSKCADRYEDPAKYRIHPTLLETTRCPYCTTPLRPVAHLAQQLLFEDFGVFCEG